MSIVVADAPRIAEIDVTSEVIIAKFSDGRSVSVPLAWSWRLSDATPEQRANWEIIGNGQGVHWPEIDEDLSASGMLFGMPAPPPPGSRRSSIIPVHEDADASPDSSLLAHR